MGRVIQFPGGAKVLSDAIGRRGLLRSENGLGVEVEISDARIVFGRVDVLVTPVAGTGAAWVARERVVEVK